MKNNFFFLSFIFFFILKSISFGEIFEFESNDIKILEKGNIVNAFNGVKVVSDNGIYSESERAVYDKKNNILTLYGNVLINDSINKIQTESDEAEYFKNEERMKLFGNVLINDSINKIQTESDEVLYYKKKDLLESVGESETIIEGKYFLKSIDMIFDRSLMELSSDNYSKIRNNIGNSVEANNFMFKINKDLIYGKDIAVSDSNYNIYNLKSGVVDLKDSKLAGKDINIDFYDLLFGNENNKPRLTGKSIVSDINKTKVYKGVFTTCAQKKDKCPPWTIYADEVTHIKEEKIMKYKNAWLKIFDIPVFYTPYFFHPDPSVKRQSGFLTPSYRNSNIFDRSFQIPYYKVISDNKDMTISPELFVNNSILLQTEYREAYKNSDLILDFSINRDEGVTKRHFFSNILGKNEKGDDFKFNLEHVSNDDYLKAHKIKSPIVNNYSVLHSYLKFYPSSENHSLYVSTEIYEDLGKTKADRFEYILPNYNFSKSFQALSLDGNFNINSNGYAKNFNTNINEIYVGNDLKYTSLNFDTKSGIRNRYNILFRNLNTKSENNGNYKDQADYKFLSNFLYEINYPLFKEVENHNNYLTPKLTLRYSPQETKNITNQDVIISYDSVFGVDRTGRNDMVEGGPPSITLGFDYLKKKQNNEEIFGLGIATSLRSKENVDLPTKSTLGQKSSDFFGKINFNPNKFFGFNYNFNLDNNLDQLNYQSIAANLMTSNIISSFDFAMEDNFYGHNKYISNYSTYYKDDHSITFDIRKNLYSNATEYYNLGYNYDNDCLQLYLNFNKEFYSDGSITPSKNLFFGVVVKDITEFHNFPLIKNFNQSMRIFGKKHTD